MLKKSVRRGDGVKILIGANISIELVRAFEGRVILFIDAPKDLKILSIDQEGSQPPNNVDS